VPTTWAGAPVKVRPSGVRVTARTVNVYRWPFSRFGKFIEVAVVVRSSTPEVFTT
jgi:hypothetical protein